MTEREILPRDVRVALDRMCHPLDESVLTGETAKEDARCMKIIRDFIYSTAALTQQQEAEPVAWTLRWPYDIKQGRVNYMTTYETKERARKYADGCTNGESIVVAPLYLHPPKPAAQPADDTVLKLSELMRGLEIPPASAANKPAFFYVVGRAIADQAKAAQTQVPEEKDAHGPTLSTHRSYNAGWNDCRKAMLSAAKDVQP